MPFDISVHRRQIEDALAYTGGSHVYDDVAALVAADRLQYWPAPGSVIITEIIEHPQQRTLNFFLAGGNLAEIEKMTPIILDWGRAQGCTTAVFSGRPGWERTFLKATGWVPRLVVFEKQLDG